MKNDNAVGFGTHKKSGAYQLKVGSALSLKSQRASRLRAELILELGGACEACRAIHPLEFHFSGLDSAGHHVMPWPERMRFYWRAHLLGEIALLCRTCHGLVTHYENCKGAKPMLPSRLLEIAQRRLLRKMRASEPLLQFDSSA